MVIKVAAETTPNEHAVKFKLGRSVLDSGYKTFNIVLGAKDFTVAVKILENEGLESLFVMAEPG